MSMTLEETINSYGNTRYPSLYFDSDNSQAGDLLVMVIVSFASLTSAGSSNIVYSKNQGSVYLNVISTIYTGEYSPSISLTMSASSNCYRIGYRFRGAMALKFEQVDYSQYYTGTFSVNVSKPSASTPMIWFIGSDYGFNDSTNYSASPNDMPYARSRPAGYHLSLSTWYDDGTGAKDHTISYPMTCSDYPFVIGGVTLIPEEKRYLISDEGINYTVQNNALVSLGSGKVNSNYIIQNGFNSLTGVDSLISTLYEPTIYDWALDVDTHPSSHGSTVTGTPNPIEITSNIQPLCGVVGVSSVTATYTGTPKVSIKIDMGNWVYYDTTQNDWVNTDSTHLGMDITTLEGLTTEWASLLSSGAELQFKISIGSTDSLSTFVVKFQKA